MNMLVKSYLQCISKITNHIFVSGIYPLEINYQVLSDNNINFIVSCADDKNILNLLNDLIIHNLNITILYIPFNDNIEQNLWKNNNNTINILKYMSKPIDFLQVKNLLETYKNKPMIEIAYHFIDNAVTSNQNVLIHCIAGVSRSVSIVVYYLMKKYHISYRDAIKIIKKKRPISNPNISFIKQLEAYQNKREQYVEADSNNIIKYIKKNKL